MYRLFSFPLYLSYLLFGVPIAHQFVYTHFNANAYAFARAVYDRRPTVILRSPYVLRTVGQDKKKKTKAKVKTVVSLSTLGV